MSTDWSCPIGADPEHGAIGRSLPPSGSRAIEIAVAALHQPGLGICAIVAAGEGIQIRECPLVLILNTVPGGYPLVPP